MIKIKEVGSLEPKIELNDLPEIYKQLVNEIGLENAIKLSKLFGGQYIYFQKYESIERPLRDKKIREEFNGYNYGVLARKYNISEIQIRNICNDIIQKKRASPLVGQIKLNL